MKRPLEIRVIRNGGDYQAVLAVRKAVFVNEQHVPQALEYDGFDADAVHVIVSLEGKTIGCARIHAVEGRLKLERVAILKAYRGHGYGKQLMYYLLAYCQAQKAPEVMLHAQYYLKQFYKELGFEPRGEPFLEAGIKHIEMSMTFQNHKEKKRAT